MPRSRTPSTASLSTFDIEEIPDYYFEGNSSPNNQISFNTPPREIHPNITIRAPRRSQSVPRIRRSLTMDDEEIYNTLLDLANDSSTYLSTPEHSFSSFPEMEEVEDMNQRYGINASVPLSYARKGIYDITNLSNKVLRKHTPKIKIEKTHKIYDPIMAEDVNIESYVKEDSDNIVFSYENTYYLSTKSRLRQIIDMTTTNNAIVFDCRGIGYTNVNNDYPYVLINHLGISLTEFSNVISLENAIAIAKPTSGQYFIIKGTDEVLISTVIDNVWNGTHPNGLGASHCQGGKSAIVFDIETFAPRYYSKTAKTRKSPKKSRKLPKKSRKSTRRILK